MLYISVKMPTRGRGVKIQKILLTSYMMASDPPSPIPKAARMEEWGLVKKDLADGKGKRRLRTTNFEPGGLEGSSDPLY